MQRHSSSARPLLGLYIHVPFCAKKCAYCDFYSLENMTAYIPAYLEALHRHLRTFSPRADAYDVDTVYLGGGTPSLLSADALCAIVSTVRKHYHLRDDAEITLEANPDSATDPAFFQTLRCGGFNRISLGMQSSDPQILKAIGRIHAPEQVQVAVAALREGGFDNFSLDAIYGLPGQNHTSWMETLRFATALNPSHLSCYGLKLEAGTPLFAQNPLLPDDEAQAKAYLECVDVLTEHGFTHYEISNFAKEGRRSRHNEKYWALQPYVGFGPGAHSDFDGHRFAFPRDLEAFIAAIDVPEGEAISPRERQLEAIMLALRTADGLDLTPFTPWNDALLPFVERCVQAEYAHWDGQRLVLTARGFLLSNQLIGHVQELLVSP